MELHFNPKRKFKIQCSEISAICNVTKYKPYWSFLKESTTGSLLKTLLLPSSGVIDGDEIRNQIFPTDRPEFESFDVFISHSHNDIHEAEALANYLKSLGKTPFLDNYVWGSADNLQKKIDEKYSLTAKSKDNSNEKRHYEYKKVQFSSSHVHTMLSMAIFEMIAHCESFIFIESNRSIDYNVLRSTGDRTESPWLFQELQYASILSSVRSTGIREGKYSDSQLRISYGIDLDDFQSLYRSNIESYFKKRKLLF